MKILLILLLFLVQISNVFAAKNLPSPNLNDPFLKMLSNRKTSREFDKNKEINEQTLSDILWAAYGINRKNENKRTIPTSRNRQDLEIYVFKRDGVYLYESNKHQLKKINNKDLFSYFVAGQDFIDNTNLILLYTSKDYNNITSNMHAGSAYQNVAVYCAEHNINNVVKRLFDEKGLAKELGIKEENIIVSQVIGLK